MMTDIETNLVICAQRGDEAAFEQLVRRVSRLVYARLYLEVGDAHLAEDLLQDTLLTAFRTLHQLTSAEKFRSWILRIAQNIAIDAIRRQSRKKRTPEPEVLKFRQDMLVVPTPEEEMERSETREKLLAALRAMPDEYRLPLILRYFVGADYETIQQQMGLTNGSLRGMLHRGMTRLRAEMTKVLGEPIAS